MLGDVECVRALLEKGAEANQGSTLSRTYDLWLKLGVLVGLVGPIALLTKYIFVQKEMVAARICAQSIFLLCCQAISEAVSRKVMVCRKGEAPCVI